MKCKLVFFLIAFIFSMLINIRVVSAEACMSRRLNELKSWANKVDIDYFYYKEGFLSPTEGERETVLLKNRFSIYINNMVDEIYVVDNFFHKEYIFDSSHEVTSIKADGFIGGETYVFSLYASTDDGCNGELLRQQVIRLPRYNIYFESDLCKGVEEFQLCNMWYEGSIPDADYLSNQISEYQESKKKEDKPNAIEKGLREYVIGFMINNYNSILMGIIIIGTLLIIIIKLNERRRRVF